MKHDGAYFSFNVIGKATVYLIRKSIELALTPIVGICIMVLLWEDFQSRTLTLATAPGYALRQLAWFLIVIVSVTAVWESLRWICLRVLGAVFGLEKWMDFEGRRYARKHPHASMVIGVYQRGQCVVRGYGKQGSEGSPPEARTLYEIGSITKIFTAVLLAHGCLKNLVTLDDSIAKYLPPGTICPQEEGCEPTLKHLATHTSGLPRLPEDLLKNVKNPLNPYADYTTEEMFACLSKTELESTPGTDSEYSNFGYAVLGNILESRFGKSYESLVQEVICRPLGMVNTSTQPSVEQRERLAHGHDPKGNPVPNWDFKGMVGPGGIYSTAEDLLKFLEANLQTSDSELSRVMHFAQHAHFSNSYFLESHRVGLGWQIEKNWLERREVYWHNGGTGGYVSFFGFDKTNKFAVVLLANSGDALADDSSLDNIGMRLLRWASQS